MTAVTAHPIILSTTNIERMRITDTGNVGIGTSSPVAPLQIGGSAPLTRYDIQGTGTLSVGFNNSGSGSNNIPTGVAAVWMQQAFPLVFATNGTERLRLDSSGNLGLGVTPSASQIPTIQSNLGVFSGNSQVNIARNAHYTTDWKYTATANASLYAQINGEHRWSYAASGTAGNAITFTQAMTLDANGNLLVGTTSAAFNSSGRGLLEVNGSTNSLIALKANNSALVYFHNTGTDLNIQNNSNGSLLLATNSAERMRIDSSGNLLVGTTGGLLNERIRANFGAGNTGITVSVASTATQSHIVFYNGAVVGTISTNGSTTTYATSSDYRLKENISPMTGALARVSALKPVTYTWKADGSDGQGFIAHELAEVVPDCVSGEKDAVDAEGKPVYQGIDTSFLVATLTAAIQELKAEVDALKAQINQ